MIVVKHGNSNGRSRADSLAIFFSYIMEQLFKECLPDLHRLEHFAPIFLKK